MEKHSSYFNLLAQLKDPACPVCAQARASLKNFLDSYLYEGVNDDANWNALAAAGGWCARHAKDLEGFSDGLAVSLFYRQEIRKRLKRLGEKESKPGFFSRSKAKAPCPGCVYQGEIEAGQLHLLSRALGEPEFWAAWEAHPGACIPHASALQGHMSGALAEKTAGLAQAKLEALCAELDEFVKKNDYRNTAKMGSEADAWKRALRRLYGPDYPL
jgi:hypothetical protein